MASYYQNLDVWKKSYELNKKLFILLKTFPKEEQYILIDQMRRSGLSIPSNIAEGSGRGSNQEYIRFLNIAKGSAMELETQLLFSRDFGYLTQENHSDIQGILDEVIRMLYTMIKKLDTL